MSVIISIIIPCYNEGQIFEKNVNEIVNTLGMLKMNWEIIFVEDKSTDKTKDSVERLTKRIKNSRAIYHKINQGRGKTVSDGILSSRGKMCGYLDVDLEVSASYIPLFIKELNEGSDIVVARRFYEGGTFNAFIRFLASKVYALSVKMILGAPIDDTEAGYKFFRRDAILPIIKKVKNKHWFWDTEICVRSYLAGLVIAQIPVLFIRKNDKKSTVRIIPDTIDYIKNLVRFKFELTFQKKDR